jgi:hypothetical protein
VDSLTEQVAELRRMAVSSPTTTTLFDMAVVAALERLAQEFERLRRRRD